MARPYVDVTLDVSVQPLFAVMDMVLMLMQRMQLTQLVQHMFRLLFRCRLAASLHEGPSVFRPRTACVVPDPAWGLKWRIRRKLTKVEKC